MANAILVWISNPKIVSWIIYHNSWGQRQKIDCKILLVPLLVLVRAS